MVNKGCMTIDAKQVYDLFGQAFINCETPKQMEDLANFYIDQISKSQMTNIESKD